MGGIVKVRPEEATGCDLCGSANEAVRFIISFERTAFSYGVCETCLQQGTPGDFLAKVRSMWEEDKKEADRQVAHELSCRIASDLTSGGRVK